MRVGTYQKLLFAILSLAYLQPFVQGTVTTVTVSSIMAGLNLSAQDMGLLGACYLVPYALSMLTSGMASAYFGPRRTLAGMFLLAAGGGFVFSSATSLPVACLGRGMTAFGTAVCMTSSFTLFGRWFPAESFGKVTGVFFAIGGSGSFFGAAPLSVANAAFGWRACYEGMAWAALFFAALVFLTIRDWPSAEEGRTIGATGEPRKQVTFAEMREGLGALRKDPDFRRLALWFCALSSLVQPFTGLWAAPYFVEVFGVTEIEAGFAVSMAALGFIAGCPVMNWICEKKLRSNRLVMGAAGVATALLFLLLFLLQGRIGAWGVTAAGLLFGVAVNAPNTALYGSARNAFGSYLGSVASGLMAGISQLTGALAHLWVSGLLSVAHGWGWSPGASYAFGFCLFLPACAVMARSGFTLSHATDPGHISTRSWRFLHGRGSKPS